MPGLMTDSGLAVMLAGVLISGVALLLYRRQALTRTGCVLACTVALGVAGGLAATLG
jgi:hypothetical protein